MSLRPTHHSLLVAALTLVTAALTPPVLGAENDRKTILILGDSITAGYGLDASQAFPALLQKKIAAAGADYEVVNAGVSGETSAGGLRRISWLLRRPMDVLIVALGGNDGLRGVDPSETKSNLTQIIERTREKYPDIEIILTGMQMPKNMGEQYTTAFKNIYPDIAKEKNVALVPFLLEGVGADPELNQPDMIHPNARGQEVIAENIWPVLSEVIGIEPEDATATGEEE